MPGGPNDQPRRPSRRGLLFALASAIVVLVFITAWLSMRRSEAPGTAEKPSETGGAPAPAVRPPSPPRIAAPERAAQPLPAARDAGAPAAPAPPPVTADAGPEELRPSHPITERHIRIQRENNLLGALDGAMDVRDGPGMRRLLQQYRNEFSDDPNQMQEGYRIIIDCIEDPGPESTAAGQKYYDRERGSTLRRYVARHCMGEP